MLHTRLTLRLSAKEKLLTKKRTRKVALALAGMGVDPKMMSANAYSDYRPAEVEVDARSEALNRRVEIYMEY